MMLTEWGRHAQQTNDTTTRNPGARWCSVSGSPPPLEMVQRPEESKRLITVIATPAGAPFCGLGEVRVRAVLERRGRARGKTSDKARFSAGFLSGASIGRDRFSGQLKKERSGWRAYLRWTKVSGP
jgi:hypothetical protein